MYPLLLFTGAYTAARKLWPGLDIISLAAPAK